MFLLCCLKNHFLTCKFDRRDCRREQFLQCDLSLFTDVVFPENSNPPEMLITVGNAHLKIHSQCFTRIYPSYLWHFVTPIFKQIFGQELKRSLHKYFGEKQRKIHFQYHIVGPERRYWNWISIHFLPSINHIWPPGANISEKTEILPRPCVIGVWWFLKTNIFVQRCENWRAAILSGEKVILNWKRVIFSGEKAILSSFLHYQNLQHLETGVYYIQVWSKLFWNRCNTRY